MKASKFKTIITDHPWLSLAGFTQVQKLQAKSRESNTYQLSATTNSSRREGGTIKEKGRVLQTYQWMTVADLPQGYQVATV